LHPAATPEHGDDRQAGEPKPPLQSNADFKNKQIQSNESGEVHATMRWTSPAPFRIKGSDGLVLPGCDFCRRLRGTAELV